MIPYDYRSLTIASSPLIEVNSSSILITHFDLSPLIILNFYSLSNYTMNIVLHKESMSLPYVITIVLDNNFIKSLIHKSLIISYFLLANLAFLAKVVPN